MSLLLYILLLQVVGGATGDDVVEFLDWDIRSPSSRNNLSDDTSAHCVFIFLVYVGEERKHYSSCEGLIYQYIDISMQFSNFCVFMGIQTQKIHIKRYAFLALGSYQN